MATPLETADKPARVTVERIRVAHDRVMALLRMRDAVHVLTTPKMARCACQAFPDLPHHACVNGHGPTFAAVMDHTPVPHLVEHLVVDMQVRACGNPDLIFTGATRWEDRAQGLARVEVSYEDDLVAIQAFRDAVAFVNGLGSTPGRVL